MRKKFADITFWTHASIGSFWYGLFLVPTSWWPDKVSFHFGLSLLIVLHQFVWGALITPWTGKYRMVCFLTTITQLLKGEKISDPENYKHSFSREFFKRGGITISNRQATILTLATLSVVSIQYFLF
jgi:hypothetical protein